MKVWLIYIRKSVVRDDTDLESPERQLYVCKTKLEITETEPYEIEIYQDLDRSGSNEEGRPEWLRLKEQLNRPEVAGVIASSLDRIYRNVSEFLAFLNLLEENDKALVTAKESLDTASPLGRFVVTILMALFEMEWRLTSQRMTEMIEYKRQHDGRHWGPAPFGTDRDSSGQLIPSQQTYTIDDESRYLFDALTEMYRLFASGNYTYHKTAVTLNQKGWRFLDRWGNVIEFDKQNVREILARWRLYRGDLPLGNVRKNPDVEWLPGGHQPVLPVELCDAVGRQLRRRNRPYKARMTNRVYLLTNRLHCHTCGDRLVGQAHNDRYFYRHRQARRQCGEKWIPALDLEAQAITGLIEIARHPTMLTDIQANLDQFTARDRAINFADIQRRNNLQVKMARLEDIYLEQEIGKESYIRRRNEIVKELAEIEVRLTKPGTDIGRILGDVSASLHLIAKAQPETKRELVNTLFERIEAGEGEIQLVTPQEWAAPFFILCEKWAEWESGPHNTADNRIPILLSWLEIDNYH